MTSFRRQNRRQPLGHQIILAADPIPFLAFVLEAIDIQRHRCGDVVPIYKGMIAPILKQTNNAAYEEAVKLLRKIHKLMIRLGRETRQGQFCL